LNDKVYYFACKKLRIFGEFLRKNVDFLKNSESKRTAEFYCTTVYFRTKVLKTRAKKIKIIFRKI